MNGTNEPVNVKEGKNNTYCYKGDSTVRYSGTDKPILPCGARVVIETEAELEIDGNKQD